MIAIVKLGIDDICFSILVTCKKKKDTPTHIHVLTNKTDTSIHSSVQEQDHIVISDKLQLYLCKLQSSIPSQPTKVVVVVVVVVVEGLTPVNLCRLPDPTCAPEGYFL